MKYDFSYFILISKTFKLGKLPKKGKKKSRVGQKDTVTFVNAEEELFFKVSYTYLVSATYAPLIRSQHMALYKFVLINRLIYTTYHCNVHVLRCHAMVQYIAL